MKTRVRGALCVAILCLASAAFAQQPTTQSGTLTPGTAVSGSIVSVGNDVVVVRTDAGETMRFNRDSSVNVPSNLVVGDRVSVEYNRISASNMQLTRIQLAPSGTTSVATTEDRGTTPDNYGNTTTGTRTASRDSRLPQTASPLVMWTIAGLALLGGALAMRARRTT